MNGSTVAVTGSTGFIGKHLVLALLHAGYTVLAIHRRTSTNRLPCNDRLLWLPIQDAEDGFLRHRPETVIHLATCYSAEGSLAAMVESNVVMPLRLLELAVASGCALFINTDSYFAKPEFNYTHMRGYINSKNEFMRWARLAMKRTDQLKVVSARLEHVYGPGDGHQKFITQILKKLQDNQPVAMTPGAQLRDFIYVDDVVAGYLAILNAPDRFPCGVSEVQIGTGLTHSVRAFVETAKALSGSSSDLDFGTLPYRDQEIMRSVAETTFLRDLGWRARHDMGTGIQATLDAMRQYNEILNPAIDIDKASGGR